MRYVSVEVAVCYAFMSYGKPSVSKDGQEVGGNPVWPLGCFAG